MIINKVEDDDENDDDEIRVKKREARKRIRL
jgi:hypothetical protein